MAVLGYANDLLEAAKIRYLIASVEALKEAAFIRNGHESIMPGKPRTICVLSSKRWAAK